MGRTQRRGGRGSAWPRRSGDDAAVSDVLANVLLVAITVIAASAFGVVVSQLPAPAPNARTVIDSFVLPTAPQRVVFEHRGGLVLPLREIEVVLEVNGTATRYNVGGRLAAADPLWSVVSPAGSSKGADDQFQPGDQIRFTDASLAGAQLKASVYSRRHNAALGGPAPLLDLDTSRPLLISARTTSTTTVEATFSEPLASITAADFTVSGATINAARLLTDGLRAEFATTAFATGATPSVTSVAAPSGTRDFAGLLLTGLTTVLAADGAAPAVSSVVAVSTSTTIRVNLTTSETATPTIQYGPSSAYGLTLTGAAGTTHSLTLASLTPASTYHYKILATDAAGNTLSTDADRSHSTVGGTGGGGGGTGSYLEFTTAPSTLDPGMTSSNITLTLKNSAGNPVTPAVALDVRLSTNSSQGQFLAAAGSSVIGNVTMSTSVSTVTFRYIDHRPGGRSVLRADALGTVSGSWVVVLTRHGIVPRAGDSVSSLEVNVLFSGEQDRDEAVVDIGLSVVNPTPTARTVDRVSLSASPSLGAGTSSFFRTAVAVGAGSDAAFSGCTLTGADTDTVICDPADFVLPAYGMRQLVLSFRTSNSGSDAGTVVTGTVVLAGGAGSVSSVGVGVRHEGSSGAAAHVRLLAESAAAGNERAGFPSGVTGGTSADFYFEWFHHEPNVRAQTQIFIPAGWKSVSVPSQTDLAQIQVSVQQPTATDAGYVIATHDSPGADGTRELFIRATPPTGQAVEYLRADSLFYLGTRPPVPSSHSYAVVIA